MDTSYLSGIEPFTIILISMAIFIIVIIIIVIIYIAFYLGVLMKPIKYPDQVPPLEKYPKPYPSADKNVQYQKPSTQTYYCQYCGQPLRFEDRYRKWYCDSCGKYS